MRRQSWLCTVLGVLTGVAVGQWLAGLGGPKTIQPHQVTTTGSEGNRKVTLEDLLQLIEENGRPEGLDLSEKDLSWLDLSSEALQAVMKQRGTTLVDDVPVWMFPYTWGRTLIGLNLRGANLQRANLQRTNLHGADLTRADLRGADMRDACLREANLRGADMHQARAGLANFRRASLYRVQFEDSDMVGADLTDALLESASLRS